MAVLIDQERCPQNHPCPLVALCPVEAITQVGNELPQVDAQTCIECEACVNACAMGAMQMES